jgi:hypothetical protein
MGFLAEFHPANPGCELTLIEGVPGDHEGKPKPQRFCGFHEPGEVSGGLENGLIFGLAVEDVRRRLTTGE